MPGAAVQRLVKLTGGASQHMWSLDLVQGERIEPLILRLAGPWNGQERGSLPLDQEARLLQLVERHDVPVPRVRHVLEHGDGLGIGYLMQRVEGETLPQRILRDDTYAGAREVLARQCGRVMAGIHQVPFDDAPFLRRLNAARALAELAEEYRGYGEPRPVFELALRWLHDNLPAHEPEPALVHGDFRNGNLMIDRTGLRAVLDWELAYVGDPMADLGWICVNSWRFGSQLPVGGFGSREQLYAGYQEASGQRVCRRRVAFWELLGTLRWGVICQKMARSFISGADRTVERGAIGRRASETELDLLNLLAPKE
ncbi:phosphotransferase family protein [Alcanivorax sp. N3-2A]|nr:phosphotransferase family protein [Alcanivorax sp. N3-2A]